MNESLIEPEGFQLLYEEGPCLVVAKPGGLATQAPPGIDSLESRIKDFIKARDQKPGKVYLGVPHRLDRPASGVMVFARHVRAARRVAEQFEGRTVEKLYLAAVEGNVLPDQATWTDYIRKIQGKAESEIVAPGEPGGRIAILHYRVLARDSRTSYLAIQLETGRTHQIRVQAASRAHPVLGDRQYGAWTPFGPQVEDPRRHWIALHARRLRFRHPMTRDIVVQTASLPEAWKTLSAYETLIRTGNVVEEGPIDSRC